MDYQSFKEELLSFLAYHKPKGRSFVDLIEKGGFPSDRRLQNLVAHANFIKSKKIEREAVEDWFFFYHKEWDTVDMKYWNAQECYCRYQEEGWQSIVPMIEAKWGTGMTETEDEGNVYEACRKNLILMPYILGECNKPQDQSICLEFGVIALVLHRIIWKSGKELHTVPVNWDYLSFINVQPSIRFNSVVLLGHALVNTSSIMPHRLYRSRTQNKWYLTTKYGLYGAVAIFYPNMLERLAKLLGGDFYVDFYNIHRLLLRPVRFCENLLSCATSGSSEQFLQGQYGYGKLYRYFRDRGKLVEV
jgi:hypothetical protein